MWVQRAYKTELDLSDRQVTACRQHAGAARWAYNWGYGSSRSGTERARRVPRPSNSITDETVLKLGDAAVVYGVNHAWSNQSDNLCMIIGVEVNANPWPKDLYLAEGR
jgi:hypothetical protein